jgi:thioredoxin reductase (NADPH)
MSTSNDDSIETVTILGSGPAGLTAAIYAARASMKPLLLEGDQPGGQLTITTEVENFPGFPEGISGTELMDLVKKQAARFGTRFIQASAKSVDLSRRPFKLTLSNGQQLVTQTLVVATGACARWLGIPSEFRLRGKGVSACATCDGFFFRNADVAVVGGGDTALEEAMFLTRFAKSVTVIHRRDALRASKIMQDKALANPKIKFLWNSVVEDILGENEVRGVRVRNVMDGNVSELPFQGVFMAIGHKPNTEVFKNQLKCGESGYIETQPGTTKTSVAGVFAAGDVADKHYRQAISAAGTGCMAAKDVEQFLELGC